MARKKQQYNPNTRVWRGILTVLGVLVVAGFIWHGTQEKTQPKLEPLMPFGEKLARDAREKSRDAKRVSPVPTSADRELGDRAWQKYVELVNGYEYPEVLQGFVALYENRAMYYNFQNPDDFTNPERGHSVLASVFLAEKRGEHFRPVTQATPDSVIVLVFTFKPERLLATDRSDQYKRAHILHEYIHILQFFRGTLPTKWFALVDRRAMPHDSTSVRQIFEAECEAYTAQAQYMQEHGNPQEDSMSRAYASGGLVALRRAVAQTYRHNPAMMEKLQPLIDTLAENPPPSAGVRLDLRLSK